MSHILPSPEAGHDATLHCRVERWRDERYRRVPERRVETEEQALAFVNEVGLAFLFGARGVEMPTLWGAVTGSERPVPDHHDDPDVGRVWNWKDSLPSRGALYYGKLLRDRPTLVALSLLPCLYALSPNYGDPLDYIEQYEAGQLSSDARKVYEVLLEQGALATTHLRQEAGLAGSGPIARRFDAALTELQTQLKIVKVGISDASRWGYAYVYDLFSRRFPEVPEQARSISTDRAMQVLLLRYLENVAIAGEQACQRLFGWHEWEWQRLLARLAGDGVIVAGLAVDGYRGRCIAHVRVFYESGQEKAQWTNPSS